VRISHRGEEYDWDKEVFEILVTSVHLLSEDDGKNDMFVCLDEVQTCGCAYHMGAMVICPYKQWYNVLMIGNMVLQGRT
jgi:hypothetical protein